MSLIDFLHYFIKRDINITLVDKDDCLIYKGGYFSDEYRQIETIQRDVLDALVNEIYFCNDSLVIVLEFYND